ncbi:S1C family serine protease [Pelagovum pacificum]|uniref:Trypsin-like serine protease n=2 Tax=Pelagovum pacificum TaxID=2588711 RepID=A0A5C5GIL0_9RHOB|nr:trypsin-like peptidase domain-containing protein [Pelagovum pacificum]QQA44896.1 trypsin-like peptidase domain-containing protein [Pelagovum pacificum]TNY34350.1 trypsin-like serine protease [Pelagovum pacificum]
MRGFLVGVAVCAISVGVGVYGGYRLTSEFEAAAPAPSPVAQPTVAPTALTGREQSTISLFRASREAVVSISTSGRVVDPFTRRTSEQPVGSGSGFVWDDEGHIVTNNHVVEGGTSATVTLADGRSFDARLVGRDAAHDLAVLKIEGRDLPGALPIGQSQGLEVGQEVLAIGNPFGLDWTLTTGIVSALDRELPGQDGISSRGLIQTDAAINPGNSGGPLLDSEGRLIGVNTAIFSPSGASAGIGFAIPVGSVRRVVPQLIQQGHYTPPSIGVIADARINAAVNRQGLSGVLVLGAEPGSAAEAAGLQPATLDRQGRIVPGDVLIGIGDSDITSLDDYLVELDRLQVGESVEVRFRRDRRERTEVMQLTAGI